MDDLVRSYQRGIHLSLRDEPQVRYRMGSYAHSLRLPAGVKSYRDRNGIRRYTRKLRDGTTGYYMQQDRSDDCWQAATATVLQVPIEDVPDLAIDAELARGADPGELTYSTAQRMNDWADQRGLRIMYHERPPTFLPRWIGVFPNPGIFQDHCIVMAGPRILFDPLGLGLWFLRAVGVDVAADDSGDVCAGISFEPIENGLE